MPSATLSSDTPERRPALRPHRVLDTLPDERFARLTALASQHFDVPVARVSLVDSARQWFKTAVGGEAHHDAHRDRAFHPHTLVHDENVMVVEDTAKDPRFAENALVTQAPAIRFYAGAPILAGDGQPLGTLSILDHQPRSLDQAGRDFLSNLAANASDLMELHLRNLVLAEAATRDPLTGLANRSSFESELETADGLRLRRTPFRSAVHRCRRVQAAQRQPWP